MRKLITTLVASAALTIFLLPSCGKDKYQPKGTYGDAEVLSTTGTLTSSVATYNDGHSYTIEAIFGWTELTQDRINNGAVMAYYYSYSDGSWIALPSSTHGDGYSETVGFEAHADFVNFVADGYDDFQSPSGSYLDGTSVKIVLISKAGLAANPGVDLTDYEEVKEVFDL